jgi:hypothetical protein
VPSTLGIVAGSYLTRPDDLPSLQLWLDAADTSTITASSGSVSQWNDKSGNARHVTQATGADQPVTGSATLNGLNVIEFVSSDRLTRTSTTAIGNGVTGATTYVVARFTDFSVLRAVFAVSTGTGGGQAARFVTNSTTGSKVQLGGRTLDADSFVSQDSTTTLNTTDHYLITGVYDIANTDLYIYLGSTLEGTNTSYQTSTTTSATNSLKLAVGSSVAETGFHAGTIAELLVYHGAHTADQRSKVWNYLAAKWGLTL